MSPVGAKGRKEASLNKKVAFAVLGRSKSNRTGEKSVHSEPQDRDYTATPRTVYQQRYRK